MSDRLVVQDAALERLLRRFPQAGAVLQRELETAGERVGLAWEAGAKRRVRVFRGHLRRSITSEVRPIAGGIVLAAGSNVPYAEVVEKGRGANKPMPPSGVLLDWMRSKGIPEEMEFVLRRSIGRKGIPGNFYLRDSLAELRPQVRAEFAAVPRRVLLSLREAN